MDICLTLNETRVIGCLLEKESTTPDQYPLSLNALTNACNQKSNRDPVLSLSESEVRSAVSDLLAKRLVSEISGSRVSKFKHRFCNTEFSDLQLSQEERAIICILFLRGAQTPGEIRSRTSRLASFVDVETVERGLKKMVDQGVVAQLPREAGKREVRYGHLFSGEVKATMVPVSKGSLDDKTRIKELECEILELKKEIKRLRGLIRV